MFVPESGFIFVFVYNYVCCYRVLFSSCLEFIPCEINACKQGKLINEIHKHPPVVLLSNSVGPVLEQSTTMTICYITLYYITIITPCYVIVA